MPDVLDTVRAAALAGATVVRGSGREHGAVRSKSSSTDFVSEIDIASGVATVGEILRRHPGATVSTGAPGRK